MSRDRFWLHLSLAIGIGTVVGAVVVRALDIDAGSIGPWFGILILVTAFLALESAIAGVVGWGRALAAAAIVMGIGGAAEIVGLYSGIPFGQYAYSAGWVPSIMLPGGRVYPLLLPVAWFLIVVSCYLVAARRFRGWALVTGCAFLASLVDLVIEAVLTHVVQFWRWLEPTPLLGAPYLNALGWLITAGMAAGCLQALGIWRARDLPHPVWMLAAAIMCTPVIGITHGEPRGVFALGLLPVVLWLSHRG